MKAFLIALSLLMSLPAMASREFITGTVNLSHDYRTNITYYTCRVINDSFAPLRTITVVYNFTCGRRIKNTVIACQSNCVVPPQSYWDFHGPAACQPDPYAECGIEFRYR